MTLKIQPLADQEALKYFRSKGYEISFDYRDVWKQEHAAAFTVAKGMRYDILEDIRRELDLAIMEGRTLKQFQDNLTPLLVKKGWWGKQTLLDPLTGNPVEAQLGSPRRLNVIYDTNLRTARAAGKWERAVRLKDKRPYLRYVSVRKETSRPHHVWKHDIILHIDHPFWNTWYPPNGWFCLCTVQTLSEREMERRGLKVTDDADLPKIKMEEWKNRRTGEVELIPEGIDPGFNYNVGEAYMRHLTPSPVSGGIRTPAINPPASLPMPAPRTFSAEDLADPALPTGELVDKFLERFGTRIGKPIAFTDKAGGALIVSEDFFIDVRGISKLEKPGAEREKRRRAVPLLAEALVDPDEVWHLWEYNRSLGYYQLRRRYLSRFEIDGEQTAVLVVVDIGREGWKGVTAFQPGQIDYLMKQRAGTLVYSRPEK